MKRGACFLKEKLLKMNVKSAKSRNQWIKELRRVIKDISFDSNFKYFYLEFIAECKSHVDLETNRRAMTIIQKYCNVQLAQLNNNDSSEELSYEND